MKRKKPPMVCLNDKITMPGYHENTLRWFINHDLRGVELEWKTRQFRLTHTAIIYLKDKKKPKFQYIPDYRVHSNRGAKTSFAMNYFWRL